MKLFCIAMAKLAEEQVLAGIAAYKEQVNKPSKFIQSERSYFVGLLQRQAEPNDDGAKDKDIFNKWYD